MLYITLLSLHLFLFPPLSSSMLLGKNYTTYSLLVFQRETLVLNFHRFRLSCFHTLHNPYILLLPPLLPIPFQVGVCLFPCGTYWPPFLLYLLWSNHTHCLLLLSPLFHLNVWALLLTVSYSLISETLDFFFFYFLLSNISSTFFPSHYSTC